MSERTMEWAMELSKQLWDGKPPKSSPSIDPKAEDLLRAKCRWEQMTRTAVLMEWGDPRDWPSYK